MAAVQEVEAAVGEDQRLAAGAGEAFGRVLRGEELGARVARGGAHGGGSGLSPASRRMASRTAPAPASRRRSPRASPSASARAAGPSTWSRRSALALEAGDEPVEPEGAAAQAGEGADRDLAAALEARAGRRARRRRRRRSPRGGGRGQRSHELGGVGAGDHGRGRPAPPRAATAPGSRYGGDAVAPPQALDAGGGEEDGVVVAGVEAGEAGVEVAAEVDHLEVGPEAAELRAAAQGAGADAGAGGQPHEVRGLAGARRGGRRAGPRARRWRRAPARRGGGWGRP